MRRKEGRALLASRTISHYRCHFLFRTVAVSECKPAAGSFADSPLQRLLCSAAQSAMINSLLMTETALKGRGF